MILTATLASSPVGSFNPLSINLDKLPDSISLMYSAMRSGLLFLNFREDDELTENLLI
jgi:hypothetical protein